jgi:hypothetical protein
MKPTLTHLRAQIQNYANCCKRYCCRTAVHLGKYKTTVKRSMPCKIMPGIHLQIQTPAVLSARPFLRWFQAFCAL